MAAVVISVCSFAGAAIAVAVACTTFAGDAILEDDAAATRDGAGEAADEPRDGGPASADARADANARDARADAPSATGCSDGTREGFGETTLHIAACQGAWTIGGLAPGGQPLCQRGGGNDGLVPDGTGCSADDLCAIGWHVCRDAVDVGAHGGAAPGGPCTTGPAASGGGAFFATAQASGGVGVCNPDAAAGFDDVFGCGDVFSGSACPPLNASIGTLTPLPGFSFGPDSHTERASVVKFPGDGGVLCCAN